MNTYLSSHSNSEIFIINSNVYVINTTSFYQGSIVVNGHTEHLWANVFDSNLRFYIESNVNVCNIDLNVTNGNFYVTSTANILTFNVNNDVYVNSNLYVSNSLHLTGALYDSANSPGSLGLVLVSTGTATAWGTAAGGNVFVNANPGGSTTDVQYGNAGSFAGNDNFQYNYSTITLKIGSATINSTNFSGTSNNSTYLNGQNAAYYTNGSNINTGTIAVGRLGSGTTNSTTILYGNGVWALAPTGGGGGNTSPGGSNTNIQYDNSGSFAGNGNFTFDYTTTTLSVGSATINSTNFSGTSNNATYLGGISSSLYVNTSMLSGNLSSYVTTTMLSGNLSSYVTNTYMQGLSYVNTSMLSGNLSNYVTTTMLSGNLSSYVNTSMLSGNLSSYQTTAGLSGNVATMTANNATYFNGQNAAYYVTNTYMQGLSYVNTAMLSGNLSSYVTTTMLSGNLSSYVTTTMLSGNLSSYQTTAGLSGNVATLTANNTTYFNGQNAAYYVTNTYMQGLNYVNTSMLSGNLSSYVTTTMLSGNLSSYQTTAGLSANVATMTANNTSYLGGAAASVYVNTSGAFILTGNQTFNANVTINSVLTINSIYANSSTGTSGQVLSSNGTGVYWSVAPAKADLTFYFAFLLNNGEVLYTYYPTSNQTISVANSIAIVPNTGVATANATIYLYVNGSPIGNIQFQANTTNGVCNFTTFTLTPGQQFQLINQAVRDLSLSNISISLSGVRS